MMQFTQIPDPFPIASSPPSPSAPQMINKNSSSNSSINQAAIRSRTWPGFPTPKSIGSFGDANCMEQLLVHCANAIETNDATLAQQILWVLNNIAPPDGDSNQRLTCGFLRALVARAARSGNTKLLTAVATTAGLSPVLTNHKFSIIELASFVDLTPWHRFGFTAANAAVLEAADGCSVIHIVDLSLTHCMQIPTLIDAIATRLTATETLPIVKLTVAGAMEDFPPMLDLSYDELGAKLINFARSRNIAMEFRVIPSTASDGFSTLIEQLRIQQLIRPEINEALIINCHMMLHYIPEETLSNENNLISISNSNSNNSIRAMFLKALRALNPTLVLLIDEDADFTSNNLVHRLRSAYNYLWIPYDTVDTFLPRGSNQRQWYEADICWKIDNVISQEGCHRVERLEPKTKWVQRMQNSGFRGAAFSDESVAEVKSMLDEHSAGWGLKKEEDDHLVLTWKGHNVVFATAWMPTFEVLFDTDRLIVN